MLLLWVAFALAQDTAEPIEDTDKVVGPVTTGQAVVLDDPGRRSFRVSGKYWLIRDDALRTAVANALVLPKLEDGLRECRDEAIACGIDAAEAWGKMKETFDADTGRLDGLQQQVSTLTVELAVARRDSDQLRRQRNIAYAVTGVVTGAVLIGTGVGLGVTFAR